MFSGKPWACGANVPALATNLARSSQNFNKSLWSMSCCPHAPASRFASDVSAAPPTIRQSCCNASACKFLHTSNLQTCSEDLGIFALKTNNLPFELRKLGSPDCEPAAGLRMAGPVENDFAG